MATSWILNKNQGGLYKPAPVQATAFGMSSLAACSSNGITYLDDKHLYRQIIIGSTVTDSSSIIYDPDKSAIGVANEMYKRTLSYSLNNASATPPNIFSLRRDNLLI
jgi:hypothetical protein